MRSKGRAVAPLVKLREFCTPFRPTDGEPSMEKSLFSAVLRLTTVCERSE